MIVIVPTARPLGGLAAYALWRAQTYTASELCFCPAPGVNIPEAAGGGATVLPPTDSIGAARNAGLAYARARGHEWAVFWDDDNYYGPGYLAEVAREYTADRSVDVLSKGLAFVRHDSGLWRYEPPLGFFPGHSTSVKVAACVDFPEWSLSEDVEWSKRMLAAGARAKHLPPWGLVYDRRSPWGHAYDADEALFLAAHGPARPVLGDPGDSVVDEGRALAYGPVRGRNSEAIFAALARRSRLRGAFT